MAPKPQLDDDSLLAGLLDELQAESLASGGQIQWAKWRERYPDLVDELRELWVTANLAQDLYRSGFEDRVGDLRSREEFSVLGVGDPVVVGRVSPSSIPHQGRIGDYELVAELGRGGMGVVYRARQVSLGREVAVKMIAKGLLASSDDMSRLRAEAGAAARLDHPHIVKVYEVGEEAGQPFFSMQLVEGVSLAERLRERPLSPRETAELMIPVCRAIAHAHEKGVLHRDLKPSNILLDQVGHPYVSDFGLAKVVRLTNEVTSNGRLIPASLTRTGAILGTPGYMAPEQIIVGGEVSVAADIYSLGAILYACLTGRAPFQSASPVEALLMSVDQDPVAPRLLNPLIDVDLEMITLKALQKPPDLRYSSANSLADDLNAYIKHEPIEARSSRFSDILSRAFRPTHHAHVLRNWGLLWMWHAVVLLSLCVLTNVMQLQEVSSRLSYVLLWTCGLGIWAAIFWNLRQRSGSVTFVERQIAHIWAASMASSTMLFAVEMLLGLPALRLSPVLALILGAVFLVKAGILSGEFYFQAIALFLVSVPMALFPSYGITVFGVISAICFLIPGWKFHQERLADDHRSRAKMAT